jgi:ferrous iron transport protein B
MNVATLPTPSGQSYVALVGNPNCGKTALFNLLTGARQKVANYAGVTVERKQGSVVLANGSTLSIVDLPGTYSLSPSTIDETVTHDVLMGFRPGETPPDVIIAVLDATNLRMNLRLVLQLHTLGIPMVVALNMMDVARANGLQINVDRLATELGLPVIETLAIDNSLLGNWLTRWSGRSIENGRKALLQAAQQACTKQAGNAARFEVSDQAQPDQLNLQMQVNQILSVVTPIAPRIERFNHRIDAVVMHPV